MDSQIIIKIVLIVAVVAAGGVLFAPASGARRLALRRLAMLGLLVVAIFAIVFPDIITNVARWFGVGRGTDLLLYGLIVVFVANSLSNARRNRQLEEQTTDLARAVAIQNAPRPWESTPDARRDTP